MNNITDGRCCFLGPWIFSFLAIVQFDLLLGFRKRPLKRPSGTMECVLWIYVLLQLRLMARERDYLLLASVVAGLLNVDFILQFDCDLD